MEPHTKYVLYMLASRGEKLDRIVILESSKVRTERLDQWGKETATTLFEKRIRNYLGKSETVNISLKDELEERQETSIDLKLYQDYFPEILKIIWKILCISGMQCRPFGEMENRFICIWICREATGMRSLK